MSGHAAQTLWEARLNHEILPRNFQGYPNSEEDAYAIQKLMITKSNRQVIGWKLGATSAAAMEIVGVTKPFTGPLFSDFCHKDGDEIELYSGEVLETEFTLKIKTDIPYQPEAHPIALVETAIGAIIPSFEIVGCRFGGKINNSGFRPIADGGANIGCILGQAFSNIDFQNLGNHKTTLKLNGEQVATGQPSDLSWTPLIESVSWLASQPIMAGRGLIAGDIVMTGTVTGMTPLAPGDIAEADFGELGILRAQFHGR